MMEQEAPDCCEERELHRDAMHIVRRALPDETRLHDLAELYKLFSDYSRVKLLYLLAEAEQELCVCDITELMEINQSAVSNHLRLLRSSKLIKYRKEGKNTFYSVADSHVRTILRQGMEHFEEEIGER